MKRKTNFVVSLLVGLILLGGCAQEDRGELPPPPKTYTEEEIAAMPPQAQARVRQQQQYSKKMAESAKQRAEGSQGK